MKEDFLDIIKTKSEANKFFEFVDLVVQGTYGTEGFNKEILESAGKSVLKDEHKALPKWFDRASKQVLKNPDTESVRETLQRLAKLLSEAELVKIEVAFNPSVDFINETYELIKDSGTSKFLLDIEVNPDVTGGAKFFIGGKYLDITLNSIVEKYLRTKDVIKK